MKQVHNIKVKVFAKEEDAEAIKEKLLSLFPFELKKQFSDRTAYGFGDKKIKVFEVFLEKQKEVKLFLGFLNEKLSKEQKNMLVMQVDSRLDDEMHFFIRLDKDKLMNDKFFITDSGNCFHVKMSIAAYPAKKEVGSKVVQNIFK